MLAAPAIAQEWYGNRELVVQEDSAVRSSDITSRFSLGLGLDGGLFSADTASFGISLLFEDHITKFVSIGLRANASYDFDKLFTAEPLFLVRLYAFSFSKFPFFLEADLGAALLMHETGFYATFSGGAILGVRFSAKKWYIEPYFRVGYPFMGSIGVAFGYSL